MKTNDKITRDAKRKDTRYFYPVRDALHPDRVRLVPVSRAVYQAVYPDIWRTQKLMQNLGRCTCPKRELWCCDGDCEQCSYASVGKHVSLDAPAQSAEGLVSVGDTIADESANIEEILTDVALLDALHEELRHLDPEGRAICEAKAQGLSERDAARAIGINASTFRRHWMKIREHLYERLNPYI